MIGQAVLLECIRDPDVELVVTVGRKASGSSDPKLREIVHADLADLSAIESQLAGFDACFYCLGVASTGMSEATTHASPSDSRWPRARSSAARIPA
jgi:putative NADH-flavin reductase